ncbi:MAG: hypothetical protein ACLFU5_08415 [Thermoplasmata archaeon]
MPNTSSHLFNFKISELSKSLRKVDNWINWKDEEGKKIPVSPGVTHELYPVDVTDQANQVSFFMAFKWAKLKKNIGVGFVFNRDDDFVGIDLDNCRSSGDIDEEMKGIIEKLDSYTEISPSGTGLHIIVRCEDIKSLETMKNSDIGVEIYPKNRYFTVTGDVINRVGKIPYRGEEVRGLIDEYKVEEEEKKDFKKKSFEPVEEFEDMDDKELLERAFNSENGDKFKRLWEGDISDYPSHSEADLALLSMLAFWTHCDRFRMEKLFEKSGLVRDKWREREDYREITIEKAVESNLKGLFRR